MVALPSSRPGNEPLPSEFDGRRMTLAEFEALPETKPYLQWWDGVVVQKAVPKRPHRKLQSALDRWLAAYGERAGGSWGPEAHVWFEGLGYLVPDLAYWAPGKPEGDDDRSLPPTLAIEIRSPGETQAAQRAKCREMRAHGVDVCWLVDPISRSVERFEGNDDAEPFAANGVLASPHLLGFTLPLADLWAVLA